MIDVEKLEPYFYGLTAKYRLIVYLLATGEYTFNTVKLITVKELIGLCKSKLIVSLELVDICDDICEDKDSDSLAFTIPSGRKYTVSVIKDTLKRAHKNAGVEYISRSQFVKNMKNK